MTISKRFLITVFSLVFFAFSQPVLAEATAKADVAAAAKSSETNSNLKNDPAAIKALAKIDLKNLPKNISSIIPKDGEVFIISVGETKLIGAGRPRKCLDKDPPSFEEAKVKLPVTQLLTFSDGGVYERNSEHCGGAVPARAIFATGVKAGTEKLVILNWVITVIVK
jgi:hypothetical protein